MNKGMISTYVRNKKIWKASDEIEFKSSKTVPLYSHNRMSNPRTAMDDKHAMTH